MWTYFGEILTRAERESQLNQRPDVKEVTSWFVDALGDSAVDIPLPRPVAFRAQFA